MVEASGRTPTHYGDNWWTGVFDPLRNVANKVADFFAPAAEASGGKDAYEINVELPGVSENDVAISVDHGTLTVSGEKHFERTEEGRTYFFSERSYGRFQRSFRLPADSDHDKIDATFKDGILCIKVAKKQAHEKAKTIEIRKL